MLRIDPAKELGPWRFNAWVSLVLFVLAAAFFVWWQVIRPRRRREPERDKPPTMTIPKGRVRSSR
jgi:flagellar biosynthesis/type III secretory pathway M-ring protein FliF/YscJ